MTDTSALAISREERQVKALKLRKEGWSYRAIGDELGISDDTARNDVLDGLKMIAWTRDEEALEVSQMVKDRNNEIIMQIYEKCLAGDMGAIDRLIKLNDQLLDIVGGRITKHDITSGGKALEVPIHTVEVMLAYGGVRETTGPSDDSATS